jgi:predicted secreted protein
MEMPEERRTINAGGEFAIRLEVAPTAGYAWYLTEYPEELEQIGSGFAPAAEAAKAGGTRTQVFRFLAMTPGSYMLTFEMKRQDDADATTRQRVRVSVR